MNERRDARSNVDALPPTRNGYLDQVQRSDLISHLLEHGTGFIRRQYPVFLVIILCALGLGLVYLFTTPAQYAAQAVLLIDSNKVRILQPQQQALGDAPLDTDQVETQVEILKSEKIALAVIKDQRLAEDPEFVTTGGGFFSSLRGLMGAEVPAAGDSETVRLRTAVRAFLGRRTITRVGRTYALVIGFTSPNPEHAAAIANAIADAYILDQLDSKYQATRRASDWLQDRIKELETRALVADRAVLEFKEANNIVDIGGDAGAGGSSRLIGERQLAELSTQLMNSRVATGDAKARLDRIDEVMKHDIGDATVTDSLRDEVINRLRNQYVDMAAREATLSSRYGPDHQAAVNLRNQMEELRRSISNELGRIAAGYRSDYEIAKEREDSLQKKFASLVNEGQLINRDRLGLNELESSAKVYHTIYDNFLQLYREAIQQQSFPITESRILSPAAPPAQKSSPIGSLVLSIAGLLGIVLSFGVAALREVFDLAFRTSGQVEEALRTPCLAILPAVKPNVTAAMKKGGSDQEKMQLRSAPDREAIGGRGPRPAGADVPQDKAVSLTNALMRHVIEKPFSGFAEGFRGIKIAAELAAVIKQNKVIGITSTLPNEGKSTVAYNLAELMADAGKRVILVDADLRNPTLARSLEPKPQIGLLELLSGHSDLQQVLGFDAQTGLSFLPAVIGPQFVHSDEVLSSDAFRRLVDQLRQRFDFIIVDLPPLGPVVDVRAAAQIIDSFVFVVAWGRTRINVVQRHLRSAPEVQDRLLGVVLNKADVKMLERYEHHYGNLYRYQPYRQA
jgi:succinoglycan biosynthesis transport protein ExoP